MDTIVELAREFSYEAAHWLPKVPDGHPCGRLHGHSYRLTVTVRGPVQPDGFVTDFAEIKAAAAPVIDRLDHHCLNDVLDNPTIEHQLVWLWNELRTLPHLYGLTLRETDKNSATYHGPGEDN